MRLLKRPYPLSRTILNVPVFLLTVFTSVLLYLTGCKEDPSILGIDIMPAKDHLFVKIDSSSAINAYTITGKHVVTTSNTFYPIGSMKDSIFGFANAGIVAQYIPVSTTAPSFIAYMDSMILTLDIARAYGDSLKPQTVRVYELTDDLRSDTFYYSDYNVTGNYFPEEIGSASFLPGDSVISIHLTNPDYFFKFIGKPDSIFEKAANFIKVFNGFYIKTDDVTNGGGFTLINPGSITTRLDMYYNGGEGGTSSLLYTMFLSSSVTKFSVYSHSYNTFPVSKNLDVVNANDSLLFVEGLAGVSVRLEFPQLETYFKDKKVAINNASLVVPVDNLTFGNLPEGNFPARLMLFQVYDNGDYDYLHDFRINNSYFGGTYDKVKKAFVFNLGLHLQSYLDRKIENTDLVMLSYSSNDSPNRVVLKGVGGKKSGLKLQVTYIEL